MNIESINRYMCQQLWMDFEITKIGANSLEMHGYLDEGCNDCIIIRFRDVHALNITTRFTYEGYGDFISLAGDSYAYSLNVEYDVPSGNNIFLLLNTNIPNQMFVIAHSIDLEVIT